MKSTINSACFLLALSLVWSSNTHNAFGCATDLKSTARSSKESAWTKYWKSHRLTKTQNPKISRTPSSDLTSWSKDRLWGGQNSSIWKPETIVANASSEALEEGYAKPGAQEVLVSIPVKMLYGNTRPYGDGQTNAAISFGTFNGKYPPVVASWLSFSGGRHVLTVRFSKMDNLVLTDPLKLDRGDGSGLVKLGVAHAVQDGVFEVSWQANFTEWGDLYQNRVAYLQLPGRSDWFPLDFRNTVKPVSELLGNLPASLQNAGKGNLLDPEKISSEPDDLNRPFAKMYPGNPHPDCGNGCKAGPGDFGYDLQATRYSPVVGVHNQFASETGVSVTAVGNGDTTVIPQTSDRFKMAYICFDGRNREAENHFGVPSGGGWHEIGDPAETVLNTLENASPLFGYANGRPGDDRNYAFGLSDVTIMRKLRPGTALITAAGMTTAGEGYSPTRGSGASSGRNYHWFAFETPEEVCAMEWVHNCVPSPKNNIGLVCQP